jgi:hypothetical protein
MVPPMVYTIYISLIYIIYIIYILPYIYILLCTVYVYNIYPIGIPPLLGIPLYICMFYSRPYISNIVSRYNIIYYGYPIGLLIGIPPSIIRRPPLPIRYSIGRPPLYLPNASPL